MKDISAERGAPKFFARYSFMIEKQVRSFRALGEFLVNRANLDAFPVSREFRDSLAPESLPVLLRVGQPYSKIYVCRRGAGRSKQTLQLSFITRTLASAGRTRKAHAVDE
jgi:hypothetical protein